MENFRLREFHFPLNFQLDFKTLFSLFFSFSKQSFLSEVTNPYSLPDNSPSFKEYTGSKNNRFLSLAQACKNRIQPPSKVCSSRSFRPLFLKKFWFYYFKGVAFYPFCKNLKKFWKIFWELFKSFSKKNHSFHPLVGFSNFNRPLFLSTRSSTSSTPHRASPRTNYLTFSLKRKSHRPPFECSHSRRNDRHRA